VSTIDPGEPTEVFTIRPAAPDDAAIIARVQIETWRTTYRDLIPAAYLADLSIERRTRTHRIHLERRSLSVGIFVAEAEIGVVGYASCGTSRETDTADVGELFAIYVLERTAGQGVGASLIRRTEAWFQEHRYAHAHLWVLEGNHSARGFYAHLGWIDSGERKDEDIGGVIVREVKYRKTIVP